MIETRTFIESAKREVRSAETKGSPGLIAALAVHIAGDQSPAMTGIAFSAEDFGIFHHAEFVSTQLAQKERRFRNDYREKRTDS